MRPFPDWFPRETTSDADADADARAWGRAGDDDDDETLAEAAKDLTTRLLTADPFARLGSGGAGAFYTLVPIRPRSRGERRSLRTFPGASLRPLLAFNTHPRRLSTPPLTPFNSTPTFTGWEEIREHAFFDGAFRRRGGGGGGGRGDIGDLGDLGDHAKPNQNPREMEAPPACRRGGGGGGGDGEGGEGAEVRSIHWFPYDRVRVVNADP
jgi:hypothetical protein